MARGEKETAGVRYPPPLIFLAALLIGVSLDRYWPVWNLPESWQFPAAFVFFAIGGTVAVFAIRSFFRAGTAVDLRKPASALVTTGLYRRSRNPIYLALTAIYLGFAARFGGVWTLAMLIAALIFLRCAVIAKEERYLEAKFGEAYREYKASVRRWL